MRSSFGLQIAECVQITECGVRSSFRLQIAECVQITECGVRSAFGLQIAECVQITECGVRSECRICEQSDSLGRRGGSPRPPVPSHVFFEIYRKENVARDYKKALAFYIRSAECGDLQLSKKQKQTAVILSVALAKRRIPRLRHSERSVSEAKNPLIFERVESLKQAKRFLQSKNVSLNSQKSKFDFLRPCQAWDSSVAVASLTNDGVYLTFFDV